MFEFLSRLRPKSNAASDIRERLTEVEARRTALGEKVAAMTARRGEVLTDAGPVEAEEFLADLRETTELLAAVSDVATTLAARMAAAEKAERTASLRAEAVAMAEESEALSTAMVEHYEPAASLIRAILTQEADFERRWLALRNRMEAAGASLAGVDMTDFPYIAYPRRKLIPAGGPGTSLLGEEVRLPGVTGQNPLHWPLPGPWQLAALEDRRENEVKGRDYYVNLFKPSRYFGGGGEA